MKEIEEVTDAITHFVLCHFYSGELNILSTSLIGLQCCSLQILLRPHGRSVRRQATAPSWSRGRWIPILHFKQEIRHFKALSCPGCSVGPGAKDIFAKWWYCGRWLVNASCHWGPSWETYECEHNVWTVSWRRITSHRHIILDSPPTWEQKATHVFFPCVSVSVTSARF